MSTRTTGKRDDLLERLRGRDSKGRRTKAGLRYYTRMDHIRAELQRVARQVRKLRRFAPSLTTGCPCQICRMRDQSTAAYLNRQDVLALLKEAGR